MGIVQKSNVTFINAKMSEPAGFVIKQNGEVKSEFNGFNGNLTGIEYQPANPDKNVYAGIRVKMSDDEGDYVLNFGINTTVAMMLSTLTSLSGEGFKKIGLSLSTYNGFASLSVFPNDSNKPLRWNHDVKEVASKIVDVLDAKGNPVMSNGYKVKDNSALVEFMQELIEDINLKINESPFAAVETESNLEDDLADVEKNPKIQEKAKATTLEDDDLPF